MIMIILDSFTYSFDLIKFLNWSSDSANRYVEPRNNLWEGKQHGNNKHW